jgi:hypothetical protein
MVGGLHVGSGVAVSDNDVWVAVGGLEHSDGSNPSSVNYSAGPAGVTVVDVTATAANDVWAISSNQLWQWDGNSWTLRPLPMPTGTVGAFRHLRKISGTIWIVTSNLLLRWTGTALTQWSLPFMAAQTSRLIPLNDNDVWLSGPSGAYRFDGANWSQQSSEQILDLSGDATKIWGVTPNKVVSFSP